MRASLGVLATLVAGLAVATAAVPPLDLTGHWTGTATEKSGSPVTLVVDLTSTGRSVTGTVESTQDGQTTTCGLAGRQRGRDKVKATLTPCRTVFQGKFDAASDSISGHFVRHGRHKTHTGTFTIVRAP